MYLKSLEIQGFKSFPDKTVLQFGNDLTAIVGPNGSGKSNISDAICWVLGEQSTRTLRGAKMEDVIFGGTQKRPAVGFAEATLTLDNADGAMPVETPEVMITRRYYRSGESEYFINRQSARLKDINELFMDTGLGREGYSNIGQGRIDEILSLKSTDRREIFEEAAGISRYRHRKEETERRLCSTQDNLLRIGDKISELELQVEPLREQAGQARAYLALREELKGLEVAVWLDSLSKSAAASRKAEADYASAAFILEQAHSDLDKLYATSEQLSLQLNQQSLQLDLQREAIAAMDAEQQKLESEQALLQAAAENQRQNIDRVRQDLQEQDSRSGGIAESIRQQQAHIEEVQTQLDELHAQLDRVLTKAQSVDSECEQTDRKLLELHSRQSALLTEAAEKTAEITALTASVEQAEERRAALEADRTAAQNRKAEIETQQLQCRKALAEARESAESAGNTIAGYELRLRTRIARRDEAQKQADSNSIQIQTLDSKIKMLREMERDFEGYHKAVRLVMQEAERGSLQGIHGPVSKLIRVEDAYTTAIETALGAAMQNIVVDSEECGKAAIQMLKRRDGGRATFLPLTAIRGSRASEPALAGMAGYVGIGSELVETEEKYRQIVENLLGRTVIAETLDQAIRMAKKVQSRVRIVTLDGQVMNAGGSMTGGSASQSAGVLSRANQLQRLEAEREALAEKQELWKQQLAEAVSGAAKTEFELTAVRGQLREAEDEVLRRTEEEKQVGLLLAAVCENIESYDAELSRIANRGSADAAKVGLLQEQRDALRKKTDELDEQASKLEADRQAAEDRANALREQLTAIRMDAAAKDAEKQSACESVLQMEELSRAMQGDRSQRLALIEQYEAQISDLQRQFEEKTAAIEAAKTAAADRREKLREAVEARTQLEGRRNRTEKEAQDKNREILLQEREAARLEQKKTTGQMEEKLLIDKLWDTYELTPSTAEAVKAKIDSVTAANRKIAEVRKKITALGTPNLGAIEEYARVSERYEYLTGQRDDVLHAKNELLGIVDSLTQQMTEIFVREFGKINEYFGKTFTEMFGGGNASLKLEDPAQPLACGIEIKVQPPGKQLKTITLLSGGEKAFVAIALYFAILKVRPTPFCMLDEIDAALDNRNVERFAGYLRNLCGRTQFIVITHRRGTMEAADALYGVTMQEQGVSKILHLNLEELTRQLGITA